MPCHWTMRDGVLIQTNYTLPGDTVPTTAQMASANPAVTTVTQEYALSLMPDPRLVFLKCSEVSPGGLSCFCTGTSKTNNQPEDPIYKYILALNGSIGSNITTSWKNSMRPLAAAVGVTIP